MIRNSREKRKWLFENGTDQSLNRQLLKVAMPTISQGPQYANTYIRNYVELRLERAIFSFAHTRFTRLTLQPAKSAVCPYRVNSVQACRLKYGQGLKLVF